MQREPFLDSGTSTHGLRLLGCSLALVLACVSVSRDYLFSFEIHGEITDREGKGISEVEVFLVDTGLARCARGIEVSVGKTDQTGSLNKQYDYRCGYTRTVGIGGVDANSQAFTLRLRRSGFNVEELAFLLADLEKRNGRYVVKFSRVMEERPVL